MSLAAKARGDGCINYLKAADGPLLVKIHLTLSSSYQDFNVIWIKNERLALYS